MKFYLLLFPIFITIISLNAQNNFEISGQVIDGKTNLPMPYANCVVQNKSIGTYSDFNGKFSFTLNIVDKNDTMIVSYLGYETKKYSIKKLLQNKSLIVKLLPKDNFISEIKVHPKLIKIKKFMRRWLKNYRETSVQTPHISLAHYREKAKYKSKHVMFTESLGYTIYLGKIKRIPPLGKIAPLTNYKFYYTNTRKSVPKPDWDKYTKQHSIIYPNIAPSGSSTLNCFRRIELSGVLSKKGKNYHYKLDSTYYINGREVYSINFSKKKEKGNIKIYSDNLQLKQIDCITNNIWSNSVNGLVRGNVIIKFNYFNNKAYISSINTYYQKNSLEHWNTLTVIMQKLSEFRYNVGEYMCIVETDLDPFIKYSSNEWNNIQIEQDIDYKNISENMKSDSLSLEEQFEYNSGKFYTGRKNEKCLQTAKQFIKKLEKLF